MNVVVDASLAFSWTVASQRTASADVLLNTANAQFIAPLIFVYEVRNALLKAECKKLISAATGNEAINAVTLLVSLEAAPDEQTLTAVLRIARTSSLSFYDASYVEAASRLSVPLATRDGPMIEAAQAHGVTVYDAR